MHLAPSALEKKEFRETWQVTALRDRVRTRYFQRKETRVLQEARRFPCLHLLYLSESQLERIKPFFPRSHGAPRVDDRRVVSNIIYLIKHGLQWKNEPDEYGPHKTLYNRFVRWSKRGVFNKIFNTLTNQTPSDGSLMFDSTHLKTHHMASILLKKRILHVLSVEQKEA